MKAASSKPRPAVHAPPRHDATPTLLPRGHLVSAKLKPPPCASALVDRPALLQAVDRAVTAKRLLVIVAPLGSGKTTLLSQWRRHAPQRAVAWLSLDAHDNHPRRFFSYLVASVRCAVPAFDGYVTGALQDGVEFQTDHIGAVFLESLGRTAEPLCVVLDDLQWLTDPGVLRPLRTLLQHSPPHVHWVLASRGQPGLPLSEFKLQDQLSMLGTPDLNFDAGHVADLARTLHARELPAADAREIHHCTEGWVAGVKLALLAVNEPGRIGDAVRGFNGSHAAVAQYLADAVLQGQPAHVREFLLVSSLVDRLSADLCNTLLGIDNAEAVLAQLEQAQLFIQPLDHHRRFYRYHLLFQDFLRDALLRDRGDRVPALHRAASGWYADHGLPHEALTHAFASKDRDWCVAVAARCASTWLRHGETPEILRWAGMLTLPEILSNGDLACAHVMSLLLARRFGDAASALRQGQQRLCSAARLPQAEPADPLRARFKVLELMLHADTADGPGIGEGDLPVGGDADFFAGLLMAAQTSRLLCVNDFEGMRRLAIRASAVGRACDSPYLTSHCETLIGIADFMQGRLAAAARTCRRNFEAHASLHRSPAWVNAALGQACTLYEKSRLDEAQALLTDLLPFVSAASMLRNFILAYALLARLKGLQGRHDEAFQLLECAHSAVENGGHPRFIAQICFEKVRLHIECNDGAGAAATVQHFGLPERARQGEWASPRPYEEGWGRYGASLALLRLHEGRDADARELLQVLRDSAEGAGRVSRQISADMALAMCHWMAGRPQAAYRVLNRSIVPDCEFAYARTAFDETPRMAALLRAAIGAGKLQFVPGSGYFEGCVGATPASQAAGPQGPSRSMPSAAPPTEPLTDREVQILGMVSKGLCNKAISSASGIALNTIKWHLRNAFTKLEVRSRTGAVARARELSLVD